MNSDRDELLRLAAKAIGLRLAFWPHGVFAESGLSWNPLADDGDALRLAVKLGMEVYVDTHPEGCACVEAVAIRPGWRLEDRATEDIAPDPCAATRRAITRAAAEIGRGMP